MKLVVLALSLASAVGFGHLPETGLCAGDDYDCWLNEGYCYTYETCESSSALCSVYGDISSCMFTEERENPDCYATADEDDDEWPTLGYDYVAEWCSGDTTTVYWIEQSTHDTCDAAQIVDEGTEIEAYSTGWSSNCDDNRRLGESSPRRRRGTRRTRRRTAARPAGRPR